MACAASASADVTSRWVLCVCLTAAAIGAAACATAGRGGPQTLLRVTTEPPGATLFVDGANMGPTPARIEVKPGESSLALRFACDGYRDAEVAFTRRKHGRLETSLPIEGEPMDRNRNTNVADALGYAAVAAAVTAIDRTTGSAGRLDPYAVRVVLVKR